MEVILQAFPIFFVNLLSNHIVFRRCADFFDPQRPGSIQDRPGIFFVALLVYLVYGINVSLVIDAGYLLMVIREVLAGLLLGFVAYMFVTAVQIAGGFIDMQMGFGMANVMDRYPGSQCRCSAISNL